MKKNCFLFSLWLIQYIDLNMFCIVYFRKIEKTAKELESKVPPKDTPKDDKH